MGAGEISAMYMGPTTEEAPTATPPINLNVTNNNQTEDDAQPIAESRYIMAITINTFLRPYFWAGLPVIREPITVPIKLEATVKPCQNELNCQRD